MRKSGKFSGGETGRKRVIVFVCTFNLNRSVTAEHFLRQLIQRKYGELSEEIEVTSAGIVTKEMEQLLKQKGIPIPTHGNSPTPQVREIAHKRGIDLSNHRSKPLTEDLAEAADLIITMEEFQKREILTRFPQSNGKIFTFRELLGNSVPDIVEASFVLPQYKPDASSYHYPYEFDEQTIDAVRQCIEQGMEQFLRLVNASNQRSRNA